MPAPTVFNPATSQLCHGAAIANPTGGVTVDAEARTATNAILSVLRVKAVVAGATSLHVGQTWNAATTQIVQAAAIPAPTGGITIDVNVRATINSIRTVLANAGLIVGATTSLNALAFDEDAYGWKVGAHIADAAGAVPTDAECRSAVNTALAAMRRSSLIAAD